MKNKNSTNKYLFKMLFLKLILGVSNIIKSTTGIRKNNISILILFMFILSIIISSNSYSATETEYFFDDFEEDLYYWLYSDGTIVYADVSTNQAYNGEYSFEITARRNDLAGNDYTAYYFYDLIDSIPVSEDTYCSFAYYATAWNISYGGLRLDFNSGEILMLAADLDVNDWTLPNYVYLYSEDTNTWNFHLENIYSLYETVYDSVPTDLSITGISLVLVDETGGFAQQTIYFDDIRIYDYTNAAPSTPSSPSGSQLCYKGVECSYSTSATDADGNELTYGWDWDGNMIVDEWTSNYPSGETIFVDHTWEETGEKTIRVLVKDTKDATSGWSSPLIVDVQELIPSITVQDPNGHEELTIGSKYTISWIILNNPGNYVSIELLKYDSVFSMIVSNTSNSGEFIWLIPSDLQSGSSYKIKITSISNISIFDISDNYFTLNLSSNDSDSDSSQLIPEIIIDIPEENISLDAGEEKILNVTISCYNQTITDLDLEVIDSGILNIDFLTKNQTVLANGKTEFHLVISSKEISVNKSNTNQEIFLRAVGKYDDEILTSDSTNLYVKIIAKNQENDDSNLATTVAIASVSLAALAGIGALSISESWKYKCLAMLGLALPMFTRVQKNEALDNDLRKEIYGYISDNPGSHYNKLRKSLDIRNGTLAHHLRILEKTGMIQSRNEGIRYRLFYPTNFQLPEEKKYIINDIQKQIIDIISNKPGIGQKDIVETMKKSQQSISYNLRELEKIGEIVSVKDKGKKQYYIPHDDQNSMYY